MNCIPNVAKKESGAALLVALVLVAISTLLGVSTMLVSTEANQLVTNEQARQVAFRAAESASEQLFNMDNLIILANAPTSVVNATSSVDDRVTVDAQLETFGEGPATGYSLGGQNGFVSLKFVARATATIDAIDSVSEIVQGIQRLSLSSDR